MANNISLSKVHEDKRGTIYSIGYQDNKYELIEIVKGALRGGHYHRSPATIFVVHGKIIYREVDPVMPAVPEKQLMLQQGSIVFTPSNMAHLVSALEDSVILELREGDYEATNYAPYRKMVEDYLKMS